LESGSVKRRFTAAVFPAGPRRARGDNRRGAAGGFTLVELLVVLLIIGIVVTFAVLSVNFNQSREIKRDAERLTALIKLARQESILNSQELAVQFDDGGYNFLALNDAGKWVPWEAEGPFRPHHFAKGVKTDLTVEGQKAQDQPQLGGEDAPPSLVYILSSGELTAFELTLSGAGGGDGYRVTGKYDGDVTWGKE
jgi:general secretion pathway protein H